MNNGVISTGTLTFHSAHNYGAMLQSYALQRALALLGVNNEIINLRKLSSWDRYKAKGYTIHKDKFLIDLFKDVRYRLNKKSIEKGWQRYEDFLSNIHLTREVSCEDQLIELPEYDYYITGSDQVWNMALPDFSDSYFLPFCNGNAISYAASIGRCGLQICKEKKDWIRESLLKYKAISVRDHTTAEFVYELCGRQASIVCDPSFLLETCQWSSLAGQERLIEQKYVYLYAPCPSANDCMIARQIARERNCDVVMSALPSLHADIIIFNKSIIRKYDCGPVEFLNLVKNAEAVVCNSFHGAVFSIIFEKPFYAINALEDVRLSSLLGAMGLNNRSISGIHDLHPLGELSEDELRRIREYCVCEREIGLAFIHDSLSL